MPFVVVGEVADASGELPFQFPIRLSSRLVIVEHAVDTSIPVQHIYSFGNIGGRIEDDVILSRSGKFEQFLFRNVRNER